jgi:hypothetical protein
MKKFMFLHFGFKKPTPEIMKAWETWFESISDKQVDQVGSVVVERFRKVEPGTYRGIWNPLLASTSSRRKVLMLPKNLPKAIHLLRAFASTS